MAGRSHRPTSASIRMDLCSALCCCSLKKQQMLIYAGLADPGGGFWANVHSRQEILGAEMRKPQFTCILSQRNQLTVFSLLISLISKLQWAFTSNCCINRFSPLKILKMSLALALLLRLILKSHDLRPPRASDCSGSSGGLQRYLLFRLVATPLAHQGCCPSHGCRR